MTTTRPEWVRRSLEVFHRCSVRFHPDAGRGFELAIILAGEQTPGRRLGCFFEGFSLVRPSVLTGFRSDLPPGISNLGMLAVLRRAGRRVPAGRGGGVAGAAVLSWHLYESRFLKLKVLFR